MIKVVNFSILSLPGLDEADGDGDAAGDDEGADEESGEPATPFGKQEIKFQDLDMYSITQRLILHIF